MGEAMIAETSMETGYPNASKSATSIALVLGLWCLVSPWVYGSYLLPDAWNSRIIGFVITVFALIRLGTADLKRTQWVSVINCMLAIWIIVSPWVLQYENNTDRLINSLCVGALLFGAALFSTLAIPRKTDNRLPAGIYK